MTSLLFRSIFTFIIFFAVSFTFAHNQVVVIPLLGGDNVRNFKYVFVTSTTHNGNLGGLSGADGICNLRANEAQLPGLYLAWLSDTNTSPSERFTKSSLPYILPDLSESIVAVDYNDLIDGNLVRPINVVEDGTTILFSSVWTGTSFTGQEKVPININDHCMNWTSSDREIETEPGSNIFQDYQAESGRIDLNNFRWTEGQRSWCNLRLAIYCVEQ